MVFVLAIIIAVHREFSRVLANNLSLVKSLLAREIEGISGVEKYFLLKTAWHFGDDPVALGYREASQLYGLSRQTLVDVRRALARRNSKVGGSYRSAYLIEGTVRARSRWGGSSVISPGRPRSFFRLSEVAVTALLRAGVAVSAERSAGLAEEVIRRILLQPRSQNPVASRKEAAAGLEPAARLLLATLWSLADELNVVRDLGVVELGRLTGLTAKQVGRQLTILGRRRYLSICARDVADTIPFGRVRGVALLNEAHPDLRGVVTASDLEALICDGSDIVFNYLAQVFSLAQAVVEVESRQPRQVEGVVRVGGKSEDRGVYELWLAEVERARRDFARLGRWEYDASTFGGEGEASVSEDGPPEASGPQLLSIPPLAEIYRLLARAKAADRVATAHMVCRWAAELSNRHAELATKAGKFIDEDVLSEIKKMVSEGTGMTSSASRGLAIWMHGVVLSLAKILPLHVLSGLNVKPKQDEEGGRLPGKIECLPVGVEGMFVIVCRRNNVNVS